MSFLDLLSGKKKPSIAEHAIWVLAIALLIKFALPLLRFEVPLGYDPGIYRYLFLHYSDFSSFLEIPKSATWIKEHSLGLFFLTYPLLSLGVPVDWFVGWIWSAVVLLLAFSLAWICWKEWGGKAGIAVLLALFLSEGFYTGFAFMYWKTYVALLFTILTFHFFSRHLLLAMVFGLLTVFTHNQTGLLMGLCLLSFIGLHLYRVIYYHQKRSYEKVLRWVAIGSVILILGLLIYIPIWHQAVERPFLFLLQGWGAPSGTFPLSGTYLFRNIVFLVMGMVGFFVSLKHHRWQLWHCALLWSAFFVCSGLFFYKRFFIQFEFFLIPFVGLAIVELSTHCKTIGHRVLLGMVLCMHMLLSLTSTHTLEPRIDEEMFSLIKQMESHVPENSMVITMDDKTAIMLRGWMPNHLIGGQGLFDLPWSYDKWETFLVGTPKDRRKLLRRLHTRHKVPMYLFATPYFLSHYKEHGEAFLADSCFKETDVEHLFSVTCADPVSLTKKQRRAWQARKKEERRWEKLLKASLLFGDSTSQ